MKSKLIAFIILATLFIVTANAVSSAVNIASVNYGGDCNSAYLTINSGTITVALDDVKDFNISVTGGGYTAVTLDINATHVKVTRDANYTNTRWDITNASYNTIGELLTVMEARDDFVIVRWDNIDTSRACTELNDVSSQDINGTTIYTGLRTTSYQFTTTTYPRFSGIETGFTAIPETVVTWSSSRASTNKGLLSTSTLDDQSKTSIKATDVTMTAGGTVSTVHDPFIKITGTVDDALFCMQLYKEYNFDMFYTDGTNYTIIARP